jgi:hypothetical protein
MATELVVALVTAGSALAVSLVTLAATLLSSRAAARHARDLETMRQDFEGRIARASLETQELQAVSRLLSNGVSEIQFLRDQILILTLAHPRSQELNGVLEALRSGADAVRRAYEDALPYLTATEKAAFHRAKNTAMELADLSGQTSGPDADLGEFRARHRSTLHYMRDQLLDAQELLRQARIDRLERYVAVPSKQVPSFSPSTNASNPLRRR